MMEELIAYHCAPALAGIKPANIFSFAKSKYPGYRGELSELAAELSRKGIRIEFLCECERRALVILYREERLRARLSDPDISVLLTRLGYPKSGDTNAMLSELRARLSGCDEFPHEIGAFLGYPSEDIIGFMNNRDESKFTGYWRVYGDVDKCKECFRRYDICRSAVMKRIKCGDSLVKIFCAA